MTEKPDTWDVMLAWSPWARRFAVIVLAPPAVACAYVAEFLSGTRLALSCARSRARENAHQALALWRGERP